jgi:predicted enzyme related to lactoylglutathione lyase
MDALPSAFIRHVLSAKDPSRAKAFLCALFGWEFSCPEPETGLVHIFSATQEIGYIVPLGLLTKETQWTPMLTVADLTASVILAKSLGATILGHSERIIRLGPVVCIQEPTGALTILIQPYTAENKRFKRVPGRIVWSELGTTDLQRSIRFWKQVSKWNISRHDLGALGSYIVLRDPTCTPPDAGGMHVLPQGDSRWMSYVAVQSIQDTLHRVTMLDGTVQSAPTQVPGLGTFAIITDSQGAAISVVELG